MIEESIDFGARIVKLHRYLLKTQHEAVLSTPILRIGSSGFFVPAIRRSLHAGLATRGDFGYNKTYHEMGD